MVVGQRNGARSSGNGNASSNSARDRGAGDDMALGRKFPTKEVCAVVLPSLTVILGIMPFLAYNVPVAPHTDIPWWQGLTYQVYPRSFQDSNEDGIGDIKGITSRLDYLQSLGAKAIWLNPVYKSPMKDFGYDVTDHTAIDPMFGSMKDMEELIFALHERDMKIIMDFIPNHTSDQHGFFEKSRQGGKDNKYRDYYIWHDGKILENGTRVPPNNWESVLGGSAWTWDDHRKQYYYHQFMPEQPDLNLRNPAVVEHTKDVLLFWLNKGVDGFRVDAVDSMFEAEDASMDEPRDDHVHELHWKHPYTSRSPDIHNITAIWRELFDDYEEKTGKHVFMVLEVIPHHDDHWAMYYKSGADMPFNLGLVHGLNRRCDGHCIQKHVRQGLSLVPDGKLASWVVGNHDEKRQTSRKGPAYAAVMNMLLLMLPGSPTVYYGDELGMQDISVSYQDTQDPLGKQYGPKHYQEVSRDPCRAPMQWDSSKHGGFSTAAKTWLPVHPEYTNKNVQVQLNDPDSLLSQFRKMAHLRQIEPALQWGKLSDVLANEHVYAFTRTTRGRLYNKYLIVLNVGEQTYRGNYFDTLKLDFKIPEKAKIVLHTGNFDQTVFNTTEGNKIFTNDILLYPAQGLVLEY